MAPAVEARSLAALTSLAADPPLSLRDSSYPIQEPLVLYIARVPGSRGQNRRDAPTMESTLLIVYLDVFLSTMKPRQKVVTAQDVESSLYYFHVDVEEDEDIRHAVHLAEQTQSLKEEGEHKTNNNGQGMNRKPLPPSPRLALGNRPEPPPKVYPFLQLPGNGHGRTTQLGRKPVGSIYNVMQPGHNLPEDVSLRRLHGPRPLHPRHQSVDIAALDIPKGKENMNPRRWSEQPPLLPPRPQPGTINDREHLSPTILHNPTPSGATQSTSSITLIRRDPGSGGQWNVGKIEINAPGNQVDILLDITNPGYEKFSRPDYQNLGQYRQEAGLLSPQSMEQLTGSVTLQEQNTPTFQRQIFLGKAKGGSPHASPYKQDFGEAYFNAHGQPSTSPHSPAKNGLPASPGPRSPGQIKAYTFLSPWNGTCEFSTGIAGKSLKCKHKLSSSATSPENSSGHAATVSELRFNLPSGKLFGKTSPKRPPLATASSSKRSSFLASSQAHHRSSLDMASSSRKDSLDDDSDDSMDEKMDLSLGQERAGGGSGGKRAKLGKLIVEDEGLKMLDLIVAANMGVWWSVYEKGGR